MGNDTSAKQRLVSTTSKVGGEGGWRFTLGSSFTIPAVEKVGLTLIIKTIFSATFTHGSSGRREVTNVEEIGGMQDGGCDISGLGGDPSGHSTLRLRLAKTNTEILIFDPETAVQP